MQFTRSPFRDQLFWIDFTTFTMQSLLSVMQLSPHFTDVLLLRKSFPARLWWILGNSLVSDFVGDSKSDTEATILIHRTTSRSAAHTSDWGIAW